MNLWVWIGCTGFVSAMVALDLGLFRRTTRAMRISEALSQTAFWVVLSLAFNVLVYFLYEHDLGAVATAHLDGRQAAMQFFTGYLLEKSLSIDNIFVIAMIFTFFRVPLAWQHRVLFWGILGAVALRTPMLLAGAALIDRFDWMVYVFGTLLILSAVRMMVVRHDTIDPDRNLAVLWTRHTYPVGDEFDGDRFFTTIDGAKAATPLFLALLLVASADVMFAIDSIPAIFSVTRDPFIVVTTNLFAILGLRALYFALAGMMAKFRYMKMSLVFLLVYVGVKTMLAPHHPIPGVVSLAIIGAILAVGVLASILAAGDSAKLISPIADDLERLAVTSYREARRIVVIVLGFTILVVGLVLLLLPGPGLLAILLGLTILAVEFAWARRWLLWVKTTSDDARKGVARWFGRTGKPPGSGG